MREFTYEEWLAGHANRKNMMEKLERSLIPYELFALIPLKNDRQTISDVITYGKNNYTYTVRYDYSRFGHDVYDADIVATNLVDRWNNRCIGIMTGHILFNRLEDRLDYSIIRFDKDICGLEHIYNFYNSRTDGHLIEYELFYIFEFNRY
ncbi:MAG: hypothetical protein NC453_12305 [Muribaculum sp.]|nr:hypothetical protein [Muribaculum sp.]